MNKEIAEQWITALRSGQYVQGKGRLKSVSVNGDTRHCCLGVLCELAEKAGIVKWNPKNQTFDGHDCLLPVTVVKWAEMDGAEGGFIRGHVDGMASLTTLNDGRVRQSYNFPLIADVIKANIDNL